MHLGGVSLFFAHSPAHNPIWSREQGARRLYSVTYFKTLYDHMYGSLTEQEEEKEEGCCSPLCGLDSKNIHSD